MGTFIVVDVTSHVISQKPLERELLSTVSALVFLSIGNVLSFAVIQKLHLVTNKILKKMFLERV